MPRTVVYPARLVRTMDPACPTAEAVAVTEDGLIRAVGSVDELMEYPGAERDDRYADRVILPGFVEAHGHAGTGAVWDGVYIGHIDRYDPDGRFWPGCKTVDEIVERFTEEAKRHSPEETLMAWGFDPIFYPGESVLAADLDRASADVPILIGHTSGHAISVNSEAMRRCGIDASTDVEGVAKNADGSPNGELHEWAAMSLVSSLSKGGSILNPTREGLTKYAQNGVNVGATTLTDLGSRLLMEDEQTALYTDTVDDDFPVRLNVFHFGAGIGPVSKPLPEAAERISELRDRSTDRLTFGNVKLMLDGTLQGFTARVLAPGYYSQEKNGIWNVTPQEFLDAFETFHRAGFLIHVHCNGDQAVQLFIDTLQTVLERHPRPDHRHTCTHSQMTRAAQYRRLKALGACANIFSNHIWSWGDEHLDITMGPDRARRNNAAATALRIGVPIAIHSDTPVTPLGPLATAKHAITRLTQSGRVMGEHERIDAQSALEAITIGPAYMLKMDAEVGSIEGGKRADFAILDEDPLAVEPEKIAEIYVRGTVVGGKHYTSTIAPPEAQ